MPLRVVISDSSCLIDLRKASLLDAFLRLPYELLIPKTYNPAWAARVMTTTNENA